MSSPSPWWRAATAAERVAGHSAAPAWWQEVEAALAPGTRAGLSDRDDAQDSEVIRGALRLVAPFARRTQRALRAHPSATDATARSLAKALAEELVELSLPAVALELVAARGAGRWKADELERESAAVLRELDRAEGARALLHAHPGLARMIVGRAELALQAGRELLDRIDAGLPRARAELLDGDPSEVTGIVPMGDSHDGGRRVAQVTVASGARVVLKPRSLAPECAFARLLAALTELGFQPALCAVRTLACAPDHGWQGWAQPASCASQAELERYFRRLGAQLAVLYALRATDMHQENVLACGEHPMLVDLETLLHPRLGSERAAVVDPLIAETGLDCVLRVGLLPRADVAFGVDISGLGRDPAGEFEARQLGWVGTGSDVRLVMQRLLLESGDNAPQLHGRPVRPHEHVTALAGGFSDAYDLLVADRERMLEPGSVLDALRGARTRVVLRPTKVYADLLRRSSQDLAGLDDGAQREAALDVLWRGAQRRPELRIAAPAERHDLWRGDVPKITATAGGADGEHHALGVLVGLLGPERAPGPEVVRRLTAGDRERQLSYLRSCVLAAAATGEPIATAAREVDAGSSSAVAARLAVLALHDEDGAAGWLAPVANPPNPARVLKPVGAGLRDGQAGIALFLALCGDAAFAGLAMAATRRLESLLHEGEFSVQERGELLLTLAAIGDAGGREELVRRLSEPGPADPPEGLAQLVLGLCCALPAHEARLRPRLAHAAELLAGATGAPALSRVVALGAASRRLEGAGGPLAGTARVAAAAVAGPLARVVALTAVAEGEPALLDELGEALAALSPQDLAAPQAPSARAAAAAALVNAGAAMLELAEGATARGLVRALVAGLGDRPRFAGGAETPTLEDGLAGIGLAWLSLGGDQRATRALTAAWAARHDDVADGER